MPKSKYTEEFKKEVGEATFEEGMSLAKVGEKNVSHLSEIGELNILRKEKVRNRDEFY